MNEAKVKLSEFSKIKTLKPGLKNISLYGVIVEFINDPPQSTTEIRNYRYHYKLADNSGSVSFAVPHGILLDTVSKLTSCVNVSSGHNSSKAEDYLFFKKSLSEQEATAGFSIKEVQPLLANKGDLRSINPEFDEDSDWNGWSEDEESSNDSIKWLLQPGDLIFIQSALTTWSHGQMVLVPSDAKNNYIKKIGKFPSEFKTAPNMSKKFSGNKE